jgi:APA family basic amino acid/polyamine antiporter
MAELARKLRMVDAVFLVIGSVYGSGIFLTSGIIAAELPFPGCTWLVWLAGGLMTLMGSQIYSELGTIFPESGGPYIYVREAMGRPAAFLYGWSFFWIIGGGGIAALAMGFSEYLGAVVPGLTPSKILLKNELGFIPEIQLNTAQVVAVGIIVILSAINYLGVSSGIRFQNWTTGIRLLGLMAFVVLGLAVGRTADFQNLIPFLPSGSWPAWTHFGAAFLAVIWTYDGWYAVNCAAEEVKDPRRTIPKALMRGVILVTLLYLLANIVYSMALPIDRMKGVVAIGFTVSKELFGPNSAIAFSAFVAAAVLGCLSANILYCPRVAFAMARDGLFFRELAFIHPRFKVPTKAILAQGFWSSLLCFAGGYQSLIEYVSAALILFFAATGVSLFILRRKKPDIIRPFRAWGYPFLPALYVLLNLGIFAAVIFSRPFQSLAGLALILTGLPAYFFWRRKEIQTDPSGVSQ